MGWRFFLDQANTLAWITDPNPNRRPPDLRKAHHFLLELGHDQIMVHEALISDDKDWVGAISQTCKRYADRVARGSVNEEAIANVLADLRAQLESINLFMVDVAGSWEKWDEMNAFLQECASSSKEYALVLVPREMEPQRFSILEPFPAFAKFARVAVRFPAVLFWSPLGGSYLCSLEVARTFYRLVEQALSNRETVDFMLRAEETKESKTVSFLHLSDLHFGAQDVSTKQALLAGRIRQLSHERNLKQSVITGDLLNGPTRENGIAFQNFNHQMTDVLGAGPILIPGNHDQRQIAGAWRELLGEVANIEWNDVVIEDGLGIIFLCFDSSRAGNHAGGRVTRDQRVNVSAKLEAKVNQRPEIRHYARVVLVHHHPYSFPEDDKGVWKLFKRFGLNRESMLRMDDAAEFVSWCALVGATLILHGHKHVPYHVLDEMLVDPMTGYEERLTIRSVGCGSSTGVNNWPLSVNCVSWNASSKTWAVSFLIDRGDGSGFREAEVAIRPESTTHR